MGNQMKPQEDPKTYVHAVADTVKAQDEFNNGDCICTCAECGTRFIGMNYSLFCIKCINEYC